MKVLKILGMLCLAGVMSVSCVSMKKYRQTRVQMLRYEQEVEILRDQSEQLREQNTDLEAQVKALMGESVPYRIEATDEELQLIERRKNLEQETSEEIYDDDEDDDDDDDETQAYPSEVEW